MKGFLNYSSGFLFLFVIIFAGMTSTQAQATKKHLIIAGNHWPPFIDEKIPSKGILFDLSELAFKSVGYSIEKKILPSTRTQEYLFKGEVDALNQFWYSDERAKTMLFSKPYLFNSVHFFKRKGSAITYNNLRDIKEYTIGIVQEYYYGEEFIKAKKEYLTTYETGTTEQLLRMLDNNRLELALSDKIVAQETIKKFGLPGIEMLKKPLFKAGLHLVVDKKNPHGQEIVEAFNKGLENIKKNGEYERVLRSYGVPD